MSNNTPSSSRLPRPSPTPTVSRSSTPVSSAKHATGSSSSSKRSRSKSNLPPPRILPFPDISTIRSARGSRDSSRAGSPLNTPGFDRLEVTFDQMVMIRGGSSDGGAAASGSNGHGHGHGHGHVSSGSGTSTPISGGLQGGMSSMLNVSSPLVSRARASTAPSGTPSPAAAGTSSSGRSVPTPSPMRTTTIIPRSESPVPSAVLSTSAPSVAIAPTPLAPSIPAVLTTTTDTRPPITPVRNPHSHSMHAHSSHSHPHTHSHTHVAATHTPPPTTAIIPPASAQPLADHLYQAFLKGICPDVRLVIRKWGVCYHVHRMVLLQASFFESLFTGGFSETIPTPRKKRNKRSETSDDEWTGEDVELRFDDPNITRAAFEICLSRLYSPYPYLHYPTILLPTATHPLTPAFAPAAPSPDLRSFQSSLPQHTVLATPRLLLSLLATTIYLGHSSLLREVFAMILRTVGPLTVGQYLAFAVGDGIGEEEWDDQDSEGAKGLHGVARQLTDGDTSLVSRVEEEEDMVEDVLRPISHSPRLSTDSDIKVRDDDSKVSETSETPTRLYGHNIPSLQLPSRSNSLRSTHNDDPFSFTSTDASFLPHFYGVVGNKIGEACVCWLARWGFDVLNAELASANPPFRIWSHRGLPARFVKALLSSDYFFVKDEMERYTVTRKVLELRRKGWDEEMADSGDLSLAGTDDDEHGWDEWEEEEREIQRVFAEGIHYGHMTFADLSTIASDIDAQTHLPYAPLAVLQAAHWTAADLRKRVTEHEKSGSTEDDTELGLTHTTSTITASLTKRKRPATRNRVPSPSNSTKTSPTENSQSVHSSAHTIWYPVPSDETHRVGASGLLTVSTSNQGAPDFGPDLLDILPNEGTIKFHGTKPKPPPHGERNFFGLVGGRLTASEIEEKWLNEGGAFAMSRLGLGDTGSKMKEDKWTKVEPFRFSVEFWDVDKLGEKERFYSGTHFYAGSFFNCYVQMIKRKEKGVQLGIYLHRQSPNEPFPTPSSPRSLVSTPEDQDPAPSSLSVPTPSALGGGLHGRSMSTSPVMPGSPPALSTSLGGTRGLARAPADAGRGNTSDDAEAPYHDTRAVTKAFFSISCASALGTALIRFTSGPDSFAHSQSWGWKSSALKSEEYLSVRPSAEGSESLEKGVLGWSGEVPSESMDGGGQGGCSLRATVVVGVV
ncbi:hypothetical protein CI109_102353 [Kwoniella shandongensis]|uniref:Uncharacterized protein n=1 Tax=Kwoniella shandongensis TaxID=1734106 RepID=A0A5M6C5G9_9TREE|nr:uncharacterized protein CI109_003329 [Kwoniella shandongensis]KAA5528429.1 hypothetical protein CI109_003329 [Kwoniella shandongensis]